MEGVEMFVMSNAITQVTFENDTLGITAVWGGTHTIKILRGGSEVEAYDLNEDGPVPTFFQVEGFVSNYFCDELTNSRLRRFGQTPT